MNSPRLLPIFLIVLVDVFGLTLVIPLLTIYAERFHARPIAATLLVSVYAVCQLVSGPLLGRISDRVGRKPLLIVSQVGTLIGFIILARASALWMIYLSRIIDGATAGNLSLAQAYISDNTAPRDRSKSFAVIGIAFGIGFFIGPFLTGYLVQYGFTAPIWAAAGLSFTSILCTTFLLPGGRPPPAPSDGTDAAPGGKRLALFEWGAYVDFFARPVLGGLLVQFFCYAFAFTFFSSGFALFAERIFRWHGHVFGPREIGFLFAYFGFLGIVFQGGLIGRLVNRFGEPAIVSSGFVALVLGYVGLSIARDLRMLVLVSSFSAYGTAVLRPVLSSLASQRAGRHEQGTVLGLVQSMNSVAAIAAPAFSGFIIGRGWLREWAWLPALASFGGLIAARWGSSRVTPTPPAEPPVVKGPPATPDAASAR